MAIFCVRLHAFAAYTSKRKRRRSPISIPSACPCNDALRRKIAANLARFAVRPLKEHGRLRAAVAVVVVDSGTEAALPDSTDPLRHASAAALILTRRAAGMANHAGQWALPGGRVDDGETPEQTALRELEEEVHLSLPASRIIGRLDDFATRSGFVITPVAIWGGTGVSLTANPAEVASIHRIHLTELLRPDAPLLHPSPLGDAPILFMPVGKDTIAAPTAAVLYQFREAALLGKSTRVAHFEQPAFAWR